MLKKSKFAWRQLNQKKEDIIGEFTNEEMEQYVCKLYMHDGIMPMTLNIETPYQACVSIEGVNRGAKQMSNGKSTYATLMTSELLKWTRA